ncbi:MAG: substrate-binding domain-containing protein [Firmicutes bacterium]|nr:substrate-binding domain-containing protein [Bacillota bacterium]
MEMRNVTISDIAQALDLSRSTIDRVLNNRGNVAEDTRERVLKYADEVGYRPNRAAKHLAKRTNCNIGVSYYLPKAFAKQINQGINAAYEELHNYGLNILLRAADSPEEQVLQIEDMAGQIDGLVLAAWEPYLFNDLVDSLIADGIPVVTFNRDLPDSNRLFYFGCNYYESGRVCADIVGKINSQPGKVAIIGNDQNRTGRLRVKGFKDVLSKETSLEIIGPYVVSDDFEVKDSISDRVVQDIREIIRHNSDLRALYVVNQTLCAAGKAIEMEGKAGDIKVVGFDLYDEIVSFIEKDIIQAVVCQEPFNQGYFPVKLLFEFIADGNRIEKEEYITRLEIVMKENLKYYHNFMHIK